MVLRDILVALNSKEEDKAINIYHQYLGELLQKRVISK